MCLQGTAEYHTHPSHRDDGWDRYRRNFRLKQTIRLAPESRGWLRMILCLSRRGSRRCPRLLRRGRLARLRGHRDAGRTAPRRWMAGGPILSAGSEGVGWAGVWVQVTDRGKAQIATGLGPGERGSRESTPIRVRRSTARRTRQPGHHRGRLLVDRRPLLWAGPETGRGECAFFIRHGGSWRQVASEEVARCIRVF